MLLHPLRHRGCLYDKRSPLLLSWYMLWMVSRFTFFLSVASICLFACFCHKMTFYQLGGSDHSVLDTTAQLTEGDQPKQPPAKKEKIHSPTKKLLCFEASVNRCEEFPSQVDMPILLDFFLAHAVHARGSDGHQNVSNFVGGKKPGVFQSRNKTNPNTNTTQNNTTKKTPKKTG